MKKRNCPICHFESKSNLLEFEVYDFDDIILERNINIVSCNNCGMIYNDNYINDDDLDTYYKNDAVYDSVEGVGAGGLTSWDMDRYLGYLELLESIPIQKKLSLVDVGCAKGGFLVFLKERGFSSVSGVEINPRCAQFILSNYSINVEIGSVNHLPLKNGNTDILTYNHVLEHVNDLYRVLNEANRVLKKDGLLLIDVPDALRYTDCSISNFYLTNIREHINHFDINHLKLLLRLAGFDCLKSSQGLASNNNTFIFPTLTCIFKKVKKELTPSKLKINHDDALNIAFANYIEKNRISLNKYIELIKKIAQSKKLVFIWGLGLEFFGLYSMAGLNKCNVIKLIDKNIHKQKRKVDGIEIVSPEYLMNVSDNSVVFLTSAQHQQDMSVFLKNMNFKGEVISLF
jgi:ubiquinone/menaquinone biosynthesis C-methylase UbiE